MKKILLTFAVLLFCTACAPAVAAPAPTPTPTKTPTPMPLPAPEGTPDPLWADLHAGLQKNVAVCLTSLRQFAARVPTGQLTVVNFHWVSTADGIRVHTVRVTEETLAKEGLAEYETFLFDSEVDLAGFERVVAYIAIGSREVELWFPVEWCPPPTAVQL